MIPVESKPNLFRQDADSPIIENKDKQAYNNFMLARESKLKLLESDNRIKEMENEIGSLNEKLDLLMKALGVEYANK